jgi:hypothetical protein
MLRAFPAEPTVDAGAALVLHVSTDARRYGLRLERWNGRCEVVLEAGPFEGHDVPPGAGDVPWDWPSISVPLPAELQPGAYIARFAPEGGESARGAPRDDTPDARWGTALFVVRAASSARVLVNLPLFTYHAYNCADVRVTPGGPEGDSLYSGSRVVTVLRPGGGTGGHPWDEAKIDAYDRTTPRQTFAHWDLYGLDWFAREKIPVDVCTDLDLHRGTVDLSRYAMLCSFGHDEYWTREKRARVEEWIDDGGNVAFFGGNTCWFRVRFDEANATIARDGRWSDDEPEDSLTGLSYRRGGGKWTGTRTAIPYRIENDKHPLFRDAHVRAGDLIGASANVVGYECDGIDPAYAPANLIVLARARLDAWDVRDGSGEIGPDGHAAMVAFTRGHGQVFNAGTTDWARALYWGDASIKAITRSVVRRLSEQRYG